MIIRLVLGALLVGHALIHTGFLAPRPAAAGGPPWPFELDRSWILDTLRIDRSVARLIGLIGIAMTIAGFTLAATLMLGLGHVGLWPAAMAIGTGGSLLVLLLFFHPWLVVGVGIDLGLLWTVFVLGWTPSQLA